MVDGNGIITNEDFRFYQKHITQYVGDMLVILHDETFAFTRFR